MNDLMDVEYCGLGHVNVSIEIFIICDKSYVP